MGLIQRIVGDHRFLWLILSIPGIGMAAALATSTDPRIAHELLHPTGEFAVRFLIIAMMATPLAMLLKGWRGPRWLVRNRRYFGGAAFGYAAAHTVLYLVDEGLAGAMGEVFKLAIWTGWLAMLVFLPLAVTSNDWAVRRMGRAWKPLQRWVYLAAIATLLHWAALHDWGGVGPALVHFGPLALPSIYRIARARPQRA